MTPRLLHLLRHGEPERTGRFLGRTDDAATLAGIASCVDQVEGLELDAIVSSDLIRARACAEAIAGATRPMTIDPRWREIDFGTWDGLPAAQIDPTALTRFWDDPDAHAPPGGETWSALLARVDEALGALPHGPTLVVTHGGAMRGALAVLCGFDQRQLWAFDLPYASLVSLRIWPGTPSSAQILALRP
jgi:alpha-ribazole phosphatase